MTEPNPPWTVRATKTLHENPWFALLSQDVLLPDGTPIDFQSIHFHRPAVGVIARRGDSFLLIRQYRVTIDEYVWAIPSGGIDEGETGLEAAARELREETGYTSSSLRPLLTYNPSYGASNQQFETFVADDLVACADGFDENEVMETRWFERTEVLAMLFENQIVDGLSATPLALLFLEEELGRAGNPLKLRGTPADPDA